MLLSTYFGAQSGFVEDAFIIQIYLCSPLSVGVNIKSRRLILCIYMNSDDEEGERYKIRKDLLRASIEE